MRGDWSLEALQTAIIQGGFEGLTASLLKWLGNAVGSRVKAKKLPETNPKPISGELPEGTTGSLKINIQLFAENAGAESKVRNIGKISLGKCYFRGTSEGFKGNTCLQRLKITPASTDPLVATLFATESEQHGNGVVHIAEEVLLKGLVEEGNVLSTLEREVGINLSPLEFVDKSTFTISAKSAREILSRMGFKLPNQIYSIEHLRELLHATPRLTAQEIHMFLEEVMKGVLGWEEKKLLH